MEIRVSNKDLAEANKNKSSLYNWIIQHIEGLGFFLDFNIRTNVKDFSLTLKFKSGNSLEKSIAIHLINKVKTELIRPDKGYFKFNNEINKY